MQAKRAQGGAGAGHQRLHRSRSFLAGLALALLAPQLAVAAAAASATSEIDLSQLAVRPNPRLGLSFPGAQTRYYPYMAQAGVGVARIAVTWDLVEPQRGQFNWRGLDERVAALLALGIRPFLTFESKSDWGTKPETRRVKNGAPLDLEDWTSFVRQVVERYDHDGVNDMPGLTGRVDFYQAANEWESPVNPSGGWVGSGADLIAFIDATRDAVKAADPKAVFVLGGIASFNLDLMLVALGRADFPVRQRWSPTSETVMTEAQIKGPEISGLIAERVMPVLKRARFDMADAHLYGPEERDAARLAMLAELTGKPVLSAECGGPSRDYGGEYTPEGHFLAVVHRHLNVLASGGAFCLWFRLGEDDKTTWGNRFTALYTNDARPKPGVYATRLLARLIGPQTKVRPLKDSGFELTDANGPVRVGWGEGAAAVRDWAARSGAGAWCLLTPERGLLSPIAGAQSPCPQGAFVVAGPGVARLLSP